MPFPIAAALQGAVGLGQLLFSGKHKAEKKLENFANSYTKNAGIMDYYNKALQRYSANPYTSSLYNQQTKNINRNVNAGISALQNRRSGLAGISSLVQGANDASLKAAGVAEQQQGQNLSQLGHATQIKAAEDFKPFEIKYNLLSAKASGANKTAGAGMQNIFGGISSYQDSQLVDKIYGNGSSGNGDSVGVSGGIGGYGNRKPSNFLNKYGGFRDL